MSPAAILPEPIPRQIARVNSSVQFDWISPLFAGIQILSHEIMLVSDGMIFKRPKDAIPELFVKWSCLKAEGVEKCIGAAALDGIEFRTFHQFPAKAMPTHRRGYRKRSHVQPCRPNISEQTAQYLAIFVPEKEGDRIPFSLSGNRNVVIIDYRLHELVHV